MNDSIHPSKAEDLSLYLPEYLHGQLDPAVAARVGAWLEHSGHAQAELDELRLWISLEPHAEVEPPAAIRAAFYTELSRVQHEASRNGEPSGLGLLWQRLRRHLTPGQLTYGFCVLVIGFLLGTAQLLIGPDKGASLNEQLTRLNSEVQSLRLQVLQSQLLSPAAEQRIRAVRIGGEQLGASPQMVKTLSDVVARDASTHVRLAAAQILLGYVAQPDFEQRYIDLCLQQDNEIVQLVMLGMLDEVDPQKARKISEVLLKRGQLSPQHKQLVERFI
jgi:hypothetical protein